MRKEMLTDLEFARVQITSVVIGDCAPPPFGHSPADRDSPKSSRMQLCAGGLAVLAPPRIAETCGKLKKIPQLAENWKKIPQFS
jgi:hypothetical protein